MIAQVSDPGNHLWSYLPFTRTSPKPLNCGFAIQWRSPALCEPRDGSFQSVRLPKTRM